MASTVSPANENKDRDMKKGFSGAANEEEDKNDGKNAARKLIPQTEFGMTLEEAFRQTSNGS